MNDKATQTQSREENAIEDTKIKTVKSFLDSVDNQISKSGKKSVTNYLFRGLPNSIWQVKSTAQIRLEGGAKAGASEESIPPQDEKLYNQALIEHFKHESFKSKDSPILDTDLGILAQLRHYNCATSMIDFTGNPLVALWFACQSAEDNNGVVYTLATQNTHEFIEIYSLKQLRSYTINSIFSDDNMNRWFYWKPSHLNRRIPAQSSYFVIGKKGISEKIKMHKKIIIDGAAKADILKELVTNHNIDALTLFPDMSGFAQANSAYSPYGMSDKARREIRFYTTEILEKEQRKKKKNTELGILFYQRRMAKHRLGYTEESQEDLNKSIELFTESVKNNPKDFDAFYYRGTVNAIRGKDAEALDDLTKAIEIKNDSYDAYYKRGLANIDLNNSEDAVKDFDKAIELKQTDHRPYINRGLAKNMLGKYKEAINDFDDAITLDHASFKAHANRGDAHSEMDELENALVDYDKAIAINSKRHKAYTNRGCIRSKMGRAQEAIEDFDKAITINNNYFLSHYHKGEAHVILGDFEKAIESFNAAINIQQNNDLALQSRGDARCQLGEFKEAIEDFKKAITINPENHKLHYKLGEANLRYKKHVLAIKNFKKSIEIKPTFYKAFISMGAAQSGLGHYDHGIKSCNEAIAINPAGAHSYYNLGLMHLYKKEYKKSINNFELSIKEDGVFYPAYIQRGVIRSIEKNYKPALKDFIKATKIHSRNSCTIDCQGIADAKLESFDEAVKGLKNHINKNSSDKDADISTISKVRIMLENLKKPKHEKLLESKKLDKNN